MKKIIFYILFLISVAVLLLILLGLTIWTRYNILNLTLFFVPVASIILGWLIGLSYCTLAKRMSVSSLRNIYVKIGFIVSFSVFVYFLYNYLVYRVTYYDETIGINFDFIGTHIGNLYYSATDKSVTFWAEFHSNIVNTENSIMFINSGSVYDSNVVISGIFGYIFVAIELVSLISAMGLSTFINDLSRDYCKKCKNLYTKEIITIIPFTDKAEDFIKGIDSNNIQVKLEQLEPFENLQADILDLSIFISLCKCEDCGSSEVKFSFRRKNKNNLDAGIINSIVIN